MYLLLLKTNTFSTFYSRLWMPSLCNSLVSIVQNKRLNFNITRSSGMTIGTRKGFYLPSLFWFDTHHAQYIYIYLYINNGCSDTFWICSRICGLEVCILPQAVDGHTLCIVCKRCKCMRCRWLLYKTHLMDTHTKTETNIVRYLIMITVFEWVELIISEWRPFASNRKFIFQLEIV